MKRSASAVPPRNRTIAGTVPVAVLVRMSVEERDALNHAARVERVSAAEYVRTVLAHWLEAERHGTR